MFQPLPLPRRHHKELLVPPQPAAAGGEHQELVLLEELLVREPFCFSLNSPQKISICFSRPMKAYTNK